MPNSAKKPTYLDQLFGLSFEAMGSDRAQPKVSKSNVVLET
jgi:hypothetical protein